MTIIIILEKDDINTRQVNTHTIVETEEGMLLNFTPEAVEKFLKDIEEIKKGQSENPALI